MKERFRTFPEVIYLFVFLSADVENFSLRVYLRFINRLFVKKLGEGIIVIVLVSFKASFF